MHMNTNVSSVFRGAFSDDFLRSVTFGVAETYNASASGLAELIGSPHQADALPVVRAKMLDERLEQIGRRYGYEVQVTPNSANNWRCVTVRSGETVLVAASAPRDSLFPRDSRFRKGLAASLNGFFDRNMDLFFDGTEPDSPPNGCLGVLTHSPDPLDSRQAGRAHIIFPSADWQVEIAPGLDLFALFSLTAKGTAPAQEQEQIEENFGLTVRRKKPHEQEGEA
jgi:hypothetical protein